MYEMIIRRALEADIEALIELNRQIGEFHFENAPNVFVKPSPEERQFLLNAISDSSRFFLVAEKHVQILGFITATVTQNESVPFLVKEPICRVGIIVVDKEHRSSGVGKMLMNACREWASAAGAVEVRLEVMDFNERALGFYDSLGFESQSRIMAQRVG